MLCVCVYVMNVHTHVFVGVCVRVCGGGVHFGVCIMGLCVCVSLCT